MKPNIIGSRLFGGKICIESSTKNFKVPIVRILDTTKTREMTWVDLKYDSYISSRSL